MTRLNNKKKGFTLLIAIVVTGMLLIVSFAVVNVAVKQLVLANSNEESQHAFYNSDSGVECAVYWDFKDGVSAFDPDNILPIECDGESPVISTVEVGSSATSTFTLNLAKGCVVVEVGKHPNDITMIDSKGYNNCSVGALRRLERGEKLTYQNSPVSGGGGGGPGSSNSTVVQDVWENPIGTVDSSGSTIFVGGDSNQYVGLRFSNVTVPQGATISSARVEVNPSATQWTTIDFNIYGDDVDNSATLTGVPPSSRTLTTAVVNHNSNVNWVSGTWYSVGTITSIIQEIVSRPGWVSGNSITIIFRGNGSQFGRKTVSTLEGIPANAPRIFIDYN